jgi:hypothetical protein
VGLLFSPEIQNRLFKEADEELKMSDQQKTTVPRISLDVWAVIFAFVLAALVRFGVLKHVTW